ncbi:unnamed protein product [Rhizophagus irregularis]|nr:unnamed protein product [Rhizophagus irregularis]
MTDLLLLYNIPVVSLSPLFRRNDLKRNERMRKHSTVIRLYKRKMIKDFFPINPLLFHPYYPAFPCIIFYLQ